MTATQLFSGPLRSPRKAAIRATKKLLSTDSLATVAGVGVGALAEPALWSAMRGVFGFATPTNKGVLYYAPDSAGKPDPSKPLSYAAAARLAARLALAVLGAGIVVYAKNKDVKAAGTGLMAVAGFHALQEGLGMAHIRLFKK